MNSPSPNTATAAGHLRAFVERIERLEEEIKELNGDKRDIYAEAKANGFDVKALKQVIALRRQDPSERAEQATILETYLNALGMKIITASSERDADNDVTDSERWNEREVA